jgi:itaconyl-CoA hydratase
VTGAGDMGWLEDFVEGETIAHARGKTIGEVETSVLALLGMNTAQGHFNDDWMRDHEFGRRVVFGGLVLAVTIGLAYADTCEHAVAELVVERVRFRAPVFIGDTLYTRTLVAATGEAGPDAGEVVFEHRGVNQDGVTVCEVRRRARIARRPG